GVPTFVLAWRATTAVLIVDHDRITVRGPLRTTHLAVADVEGFSLGRYKILGCVCLIHMRTGPRDVPVFAIEGVTGQPNRKTSIKAREMVDDLNRRYAEFLSSADPG